MRWLPLLTLLPLAACGDDTETAESEAESICNKTSEAWVEAGANPQAVSVCAASFPSCDCFVIGGTHFEEEHICVLVALDTAGQDVTITGDAGWSFDSTTPAGTDCSAGIPCVGDLPMDTEITAVASIPSSSDTEPQEVEIRFTATAPQLEEIFVECP